MKRALAMALGAMMVAGSAAPAAAASHVDFSGYYRAYYMNETNMARHANSDERFTDSYFGHRLQLDMTFTPTDEIQVFWRLRGPSFQRWGNDGGRMSVETKHVYGVVKQEFGTFSIGKFDDGLDAYGLASLGYMPAFGPFIQSSPYDSGASIDAIRYNNEWDNGFGFMAQYAKVKAGALYDTVDANTSYSDGDYDRYQLEATYQWDGGGAALGFRYDRDATQFNDADNIINIGGVDYYTLDKTTAWYINPAIMHSWGDFSLHAEAMFGWGDIEYVGTLRDRDAEGYSFYLDADYNYGPGHVTLAGWWASGSDLGDDKMKGLVEVDQGNFYPLLAAYGNTAAGWGRESMNAVNLANEAFSFTSNFVGIYDSTALANINGGYLNTQTGAGNTLLNTLTGVTGVGVGGLDLTNLITLGRNQTVFTNENGGANHWAIVLSGEHAFSDDISMHMAVGYLGLTNPNYRVMDRGVISSTATAAGAGYDQGTSYSVASYTEQDKELGWEIDLGFKFQLLDNLAFTTNFGYMFNGDAYRTLRGYNFENVSLKSADADVVAGTDTANVRAVWDDPKDTYVWYNALTFSF